jgi:hypothetical protein
MCICGHVRGLHRQPIGGCRINGCLCEEFKEQGVAPPDEGPRRVTFTVPDGYTVHVSLVPIDGYLDEAEGS